MIVAIIQARMGSTRLPGKVLRRVNGVPLIKFQVERVTKSSMIDTLVVATTVSDQDDVIENLCKKEGIECFRGSEDDVLERYYECAKWYEAETIVRLTGDCPLADYKIIDDTIKLFQDKAVDFAANTVPPEKSLFPDGSDVEVFSMAALKRAFQECSDKHFREHVTFYFWKQDNGFSTAQLGSREDYSNYRFTVDYPEDLQVVEFYIERLLQQGQFGHVDEIVRIIDTHPEIKEINSQYYFGVGWEK